MGVGSGSGRWVAGGGWAVDAWSEVGGVGRISYPRDRTRFAILICASSQLHLVVLLLVAVLIHRPSLPPLPLPHRESPLLSPIPRSLTSAQIRTAGQTVSRSHGRGASGGGLQRIAVSRDVRSELARD